MSVYVEQNASLSDFSTNESWTILSPIEQSIKKKIESVGVPLKDWDIQINYGIKTGFNDAFIISGDKKDELIASDPKSAEIIRPILRGRDIKRYSYEFADLWLICTFPSKNYDIDDYPAVKEHLLSFGMERLEQTGKKYTINGVDIKARKKTNNKWFETQDTISYWDEFYKPKIIYPNMTKFLPFLYDEDNYVTNQKCFILTGNYLGYLTAFFNSSLFKYCFRDNFPELLGGTRELSKIFFDKISVKRITKEREKQYKEIILELQNRIKNKTPYHDIEIQIDNMIFEEYGLNENQKSEIGFIEIV